MTRERSIAGSEPSGPRVCLLTEAFHPIVGGAEAHARSLGEALIERDVPLFVLTQRRPRGAPRRDDVGNIPVVRVASSGHDRWGKYLMLPAVFRALLTLRDEYDLIYVCGIRTLGIAALIVGRWLGRPVVLRSESRWELTGDYALSGASGVLRPFIGALLGLRNSLYRRRAAAFVAVSQAIREEFESCGVPRERIRVIPNGLDMDEFRPAAAGEKGALRERLGLPGDARIVVYTGKLNREKGLEMLLRAWRRLLPEAGDAHLVLVGGGANQFLSCETELRDYVARHDMGSRVTFSGYVTNVAEYLRASDIFTIPSESESFSISLAEAMASGLPAIATDVGGMPELVTDGEDGFIIPVDGEDRLVEALRALLGDASLRDRMGRAGRESIVERCSIGAVAERHERLFRDLLASRSGRR